jgi:hypothetical protein
MSQTVKLLIDFIGEVLSFIIDFAQANPDITWLTVVAVCAGLIKIMIELID